MHVSSKQYSNALFSVAKGQNNLDLVINQLELVLDEFSKFKNVLENPELSISAKKKKIDSLKMNNITINFLFTILKNNDLGKLKNITLRLHELRNIDTNTLEIKCQSAVQLNTAELETLKTKLENMTHKNIILNIETNHDLIGGIILHIDNNLMDYSVKGKLTEITKELMH